LVKITIITPVFNGESTLEKCIESVASQSYSNIEHIIVDGESIDNSLNIIKAFALVFKQIKFISEPDLGIYDAMNKGIKLASGDWILFLGSDDYLVNSLIIETVFADLSNTPYDFIYGNVIFGNSGKVYAGQFEKMQLMRKNICHQSIFYQKRLFQSIGGFNLEYKTLADLDLNVKVFFGKYKIKYLNLVISYYSTEGFSSVKNQMNANERFKIVENAKRNFNLLSWIEFWLFFVKSRIYKYLGDKK